MRVLALDLPGFGAAHATPGSTVTEMADAVAAAIKAERLSAFLLAGHSMGGKVAIALARRAEDGEAGLEGLSGVALIAASPPGPEPMDDGKRAEMLSWFDADPATHRAQADRFVSDSVAAPLPAALHETTVEDVLRADRARWRAWLECGSKEDWASRIGLLQTPALIVAGAGDPALGPDAQAELTAPHFVRARLVDLPDAGHLLPLERANALSALIGEHAR